MLLKATSGLKVNFHKSILVGVNVPDSWLTESSSVMNRKTSHLPFLYMDFLIGGDSRKLYFCNPLPDGSKFRLYVWKSINLCLDDQLVLLKSVLSCLLV
jgi:hypothetical protein